MSKQKRTGVSQEKTLNKINLLNQEVEGLNKGLIGFAQNIDARFQIIELTFDKILCDTVDVVNFEDFSTEEFGEKYAQLFGYYFLNLDTKKITRVAFPEKKVEEETEDGLLDDSK